MVICGTVADAQLDVNAVDSGTFGMIVNSAASPTVDFQQWRKNGTTIAAVDKNAAMVLNGTAASAQLHVNAAASATVGLIVNNGNTTPTGDMQQWKLGSTTKDNESCPLVRFSAPFLRTLFHCPTNRAGRDKVRQI